MPLWGLVFAVGSFVVGKLAEKRPYPDKRDPGYGQFSDFNQSDGNLPIGIGYGLPEWDADVLFDYLTPNAYNTQTPADDVRRYIGLSLGGANVAGLDGRDLRVAMNDVPLFDTIKSDAPIASRTLTEKTGSDGKVWLFPRANVVVDTIALYVDGVVVHAGANSGVEVDDSLVNSYDAVRASPVVVDKDGGSGVLRDPSMSGSVIPAIRDRVGGLLPEDGEPDGAITVGIYFKTPTFAGDPKRIPKIAGVPRTARVASVDPLPSEAVHLGTLDDGRRYFWVQSDNTSGNSTWMRDLYDEGGLSHFLVSLSVKPRVTIVELDDGGVEAHFTDSQTGSTITWTGKTSAAQDRDIHFHFRDGRPDQASLPFGNGARNTYGVGTELPQGQVVTYSSENEVHDLVVGIQSGQAGFFDVSRSTGNFGSIDRALKIQVRETGAPDGSADDSKDPGKGWVTVWNKSLFGKVKNGAASWFFSVRSLLEIAQGRAGEGLPALPFKQYDVAVVSADEANRFGSTSELYLANVTEVQHIPISIPHHASLTVEIRNPRELNANPSLRVGMGMRRVWVPESTAVYNATTGRPEPGAWTWTRNPVWCACDFITDKLFCKGEFYTWQHVDLATALDAASYCDESVQKHSGTTETETRAELDIFIRERGSLRDHVRQMLRGAFVMPALRGGTWYFVPDRAADAVTLPDSGGGIVESVHLDATTVRGFYPSLEELPTDVEVTFTDEESRQEPIPLDIPHEEESTQRVTHSLDLRGVRRWSQAARVGNLYRRQAELQRWQFEARYKPNNFDLLQLESGDIVAATIPTLGWSEKLVRIDSNGWDGQLGAPVIRATEYFSQSYTESILVPNGAIKPNSRPAPSEGAAGTVGLTAEQGFAYAPQSTTPVGHVKNVTLARIAAGSTGGDV